MDEKHASLNRKFFLIRFGLNQNIVYIWREMKFTFRIFKSTCAMRTINHDLIISHLPNIFTVKCKVF